MDPINNSKPINTIFSEEAFHAKESVNNSTKKDAAEISNTAKAFAKLDNVLNLGKTDRLETGKMNSAEREEFLKMLGATLKNHIVGYEILDINGQPEKHDVTNQIGDERSQGAKLYKKKNYKD